MESKSRAARSLVRRLSSATTAAVSESSSSAASTTIAELRLLSKDDPDSRPLLTGAGAVPLLVHHLLDLHSSPFPPCPVAQENAAAALLNLSISCREALMSTPSLLVALSHTLRRPLSPAAAQHAAATVYSLLSVDAYRPVVGSNPDLLSALVAVLSSSPSAPSRSLKDALRALFAASLYPPNRPLLVRLGAVPVLFSIVIRDCRAGVVEDATAVIAQVAGCDESVGAFRAVSGVRVLVDLMDPATGGGWASARSRENAAAALGNLAMCGGKRAVGDIREVEGAALAGIEELTASGNARAQEKAGALMRILQEGRMPWGETLEEREPPPSASWSSASWSSSSVSTNSVYTY